MQSPSSKMSMLKALFTWQFNRTEAYTWRLITVYLKYYCQKSFLACTLVCIQNVSLFHSILEDSRQLCNINKSLQFTAFTAANNPAFEPGQFVHFDLMSPLKVQGHTFQRVLCDFFWRRGGSGETTLQLPKGRLWRGVGQALLPGNK
mgnify:CR=1 FL=1